MLLPRFTDHGDLPPGVHRATLQEVKERFGDINAKRQVLFIRLERIYRIAVEVGHLARFIVFGSFVSSKKLSKKCHSEESATRNLLLRHAYQSGDSSLRSE